MDWATSLLASSGFRHISRLSIEFSADGSFKSPVDRVADFVNHCSGLRKITVKTDAPGFQRALFANPIIRSRSRLICFEFVREF